MVQIIHCSKDQFFNLTWVIAQKNIFKNSGKRLLIQTTLKKNNLTYRRTIIKIKGTIFRIFDNLEYK